MPPLRAVTKEYAAALLAEWQPKLTDLAKRLNAPFLFFADEFYIKAGISFPSLDQYGDLPQIENGVGMVPLFLDEAEEVVREANNLKPALVTVVTGESPYPFLAEFLVRLGAKTGITFTVVAVKNRLFGESVTVTGLVSGSDIIEGLKTFELGDVILVPDVMLKEGEGVFLDDQTVDDLEDALQKEVLVVESTPRGIYLAVSAL